MIASVVLTHRDEEIKYAKKHIRTARPNRRVGRGGSLLKADKRNANCPTTSANNKPQLI